MRAALRRPRLLTSLALIVGLVAAMSVEAPWLSAQTTPYVHEAPENRALLAEGSGTLIPGTFAAVRSVVDASHAVTWIIYTYATTDFPACHDAVATLDATGEFLGYVGGCGLPYTALHNDPTYFAGSVELPNGDRSSITFGHIPEELRPVVDKVRAYRGGKVGDTVYQETGSNVSAGSVWVFVMDTVLLCSQSTQYCYDFITVELVNALNQVVDLIGPIEIPQPCGDACA